MDEVDEEWKGSPLYWAVAYGHVHFIAPLVKAGAAVNKPDKNGSTPVYIAAHNGHVEAIRALKAAGVNVNTPSNDGATPVSIAAQQGQTAAIAALHTAGANMNTPNSDGRTPVFIAASKGHVEAIRALKAAGANVNTPIPNGATPVYVAAQKGQAAAIAALKAAGANVNTPNKNGVTPVSIAASQGHAAAIAALLEAGADASIKTKWATALEEAKEGKEPGHLEVVRLLKTHLKQYPNGIKPVPVKAIATNKQAIQTLSTPLSPTHEVKTIYDLPAASQKPAPHQPPQSSITSKNAPNPIASSDSLLQSLQAGLMTEKQKTPSPSASQTQTDIKTSLETLAHDLEETQKEKQSLGQTSVAPKKPAPHQPPQSSITSKDASNPIASSDSLLQSLQARLMTEKQKTPSPSASQTQTDIKTSLETLAHDLEETQKEKQSLGQTSQELKTQSKRLQETLQKEITAQESEHVHLEQQQEAFQKQIADLEKSLAQKPGIEQQAIQDSLKATQEQLLVVQTQQAILWNEHEIKSQKREALKRFQSHPNLLLFYRSVHIKLEEIFISFKAVAGGFVNPVDGNVAIAKSIFDALGDAVSIAPIVGTSVQKILKWSVSNGLKKLDRTRQKNTAINSSGLVTLSEVKKYAESIARQLTERYADQLERLMTPEQEQAEASKFKQGLAKMKESALKGAVVPSAKKLAAFGVLWIIDQLYDSEALDESKELDEALLLVVSQKPFPNKLKEFWQEITTTLGLEGVRSKSGEIWHPASVYTLPGLRVGDEYYSGQKLEPQTYGWRSGTLQEAQALGLKKVPAPTTQAFAIENQKVVQSISVVHKNVQQMQQETKQQAEILETMKKTGGIAGNARLQALEEALAKEKKDKEELNQRFERLERLHTRALSPAPNRRSSGILNLADKKEEQEKTRYVLEELRTFFLEDRGDGDRTENYATYNECLKKVNSNAQLLYKAKQNKHVLYMNGKSIEDTDVAAEEISKMIGSLPTQSYGQPSPTQLRQPDAPQPALGTDSNRLGSVFKSA